MLVWYACVTLKFDKIGFLADFSTRRIFVKPEMVYFYWRTV